MRWDSFGLFVLDFFRFYLVFEVGRFKDSGFRILLRSGILFCGKVVGFFCILSLLYELCGCRYVLRVSFRGFGGYLFFFFF